MKNSYVFLANGFEEIEALTVVDVMRRAGMPVKTVSINSGAEVTGAHGMTVVADVTINDTDFSDGAEWMIVPGGMPGASNLAACPKLTELLKKQAKSEGGIAAICAAPAVVLGALGILDGKEATCYPGFEEQLPRTVIRDTPVVVLDRLITANGPAAAMRFALAIVAHSMGEALAQEIGMGMLFYPRTMNFYF